MLSSGETRAIPERGAIFKLNPITAREQGAIFERDAIRELDAKCAVSQPQP